MLRCISAVLCAAIILSVTALSSLASTAYPTAGRVNISYGTLNVRNSPGGSKIASLSKDSYVNLHSLTNGWYKVEYSNGKYGYSSADYIVPLNASYPATVRTTSGRLYVRSSAGGTIINSLASGTKVTVLSSSGGWSRVVYYGTNIGYVSSSYLVKSSGQTNGYKAVSLSVPDYKQTDSRWANKKIGSTNYTIGQIGCTTTALAMTESYRTGSTVYPDTMESRLSYSSGGALYWPANYSSTTSFANYMQTIYNLLIQGKPVIIGAKKVNGAQHWVVVKGIYGVNTLTPTAFKINDPGSNTRTNLGQFFSEYPYLHRIVWYN